MVRFAALMHDIGKPRTRRFQPDGSVTFHHHDVVGAKMCRKRMRALRFSNETTDQVSPPGRAAPALPRVRQRRVDRLGGPPLRPRRRDLLERLHVLTRADCTTRNARKAARLQRTYDDLEERIARLTEQEELQLGPAGPGRQPDHGGAGPPPGPEVGEAYRFLLEQRMERGPLGEDGARESAAGVVGANASR